MSAPLAGTLAAVRAAQKSWAAQPLDLRRHVLRRIGRRFAERAEEIAALVCEETRKDPVDAWFADVLPNLKLFQWWTGAGLADLAERKAPLSSLEFPGKRGRLTYEPRGLIGLITPWNYPAAIPLRTLVPALVAGNAVLFKPSEVTPRVGALLVEIFNAELPGGVLLLVEGGAEAGEEVVDAADHVVFTGSVATGRKVAVRCAEQLKTVSLELGGKDAAIVMADCDLERTVQGVLWGALTNSGQNCAAIERVYVEDAIYDRFLARLLAVAAQLEVAPVATAAQDALVRRHLEDAAARGATLHGSYPGAVVLTEVPEDALVMTEETFGPLCPVVRVPSADEALHRANASRYGLTTSLWTRSEARAERLAARADSGVVTVNNVALTASMPFAPWSGRKASGHGVTSSHLALLELVQPKFILHDDGTAPELWWYPLSDAALAVARASTAWLASTGLTKLRRTFSLVGVMRRRASHQKRAFRP